MLLLFIYFIILSIIFSGFASVALTIFKIEKETHPVLQLLMGAFLYMIFVWIIIFFVGFSIYFQIASLLIALLILLLKKNKFCWIKSMYNQFKKWHTDSKILFAILSLSAMYISAGRPTIFDNDSYYFQTIQWANEHGIVHGLMNLHPFLGQFSGWHILQSGLTFDFFNDLNAYIVVLSMFFAFDLAQNKLNHVVIGAIISLDFLFLMLFLNSPSPDIPIIALSQMVFYLFVKNYKKASVKDLKIMLTLSIFLVLIKLTGLPALLLTLFLLIKHDKDAKQLNVFTAVLFLGALVLWTTKNFIITGYPLYPSTIIKFDVDWQYPANALQYLSELGQKESYALQLNSHVLVDFVNWLKQPGLHKFLNVSWVLLLVAFPFFAHKNKAFLSIYLVAIIYFAGILFYAPNFRFLLHFMIFFISVIAINLFEKSNNFGYIVRVMALLIVVVFAGYTFLTKYNKIFIIPAGRAGITTEILKQKEQNLEYYYPKGRNLFWTTGAAPLPALQNNQLEYFKNNFDIIPQLRGTTLREGFYSKQLK